MRPVYSSLLYGIVGIWIGSTTTYFLVDQPARIDATHDNGQLTQLLQDAEQTKRLVQELKHNLAAGLYQSPSAPQIVYAEENVERHSDKPNEPTKQRPAVVAPTSNPAVDLAVHEAAVQDMVTRLSDPSYTYSTNFAQVLRSDELRNMPEQLREQLISKMVGMMNNGEIDSDAFFGEGLAQ